VISVILPVYNERELLKDVYVSLARVMKSLSDSYEIIFVDDGSTDGTLAVLAEIESSDDRIRTVRFDLNYGQSSALQAGFDHAQGSVFVTMDADLENNPDDIPLFFEKLNTGFDVVCGMRDGRGGSLKGRCSVFGNALFRLIFNSPVHDMACTLRVYKRDAFDGLVIHGTMHRYLPLLLHWKGAHVAEIPVGFEPRRAGHSKYGFFNRLPSVLRDMFLFLFFRRKVLHNTKRSYHIENAQ
jgi:glycosyltransferase involved in cell wall biosynthesis